MPSAFPFDTLDYARKLEQAGVPVAQAELQAKALGEALVGAVATRGDLAAFESRLDVRFAKIDARFEQMEAKIAARFEQMEAKIVSFSNELKLELGGRIDTLRWMLGVVVALNAAVFVQLFLKH
jgi:hypothetical protein